MTTKMTKAQLVDENVMLRNACARLEAQIAGLQAQQSKQQRPSVSALSAEAIALARRCGINVQSAKRKVGDVVSTYRKADGTTWNKIVTGYNQYVHRQVS